MSRVPVAAFVALAIATVAAFFLVQALKVTTPLIDGFPAPHPSVINPVSGGVCPVKGPGGVPVATSFRQMTISFYLLKRADDVDVDVVDSQGTVVDTLATDRYMARKQRVAFTWNGRRADGAYVAPGDYYVQVTLIHQDRTVRISNQSSGALEPVRVQTEPTPIRVTGVRADGLEPAVFPQAGGDSVAIHLTVIGTTTPTVRIYRTDLAGAPRLVNSFPAATLRTAFWNGTLASGAPAPQGTYLVSVSAVDRTCTTSTFPTHLPPSPGSTPHAGVTVRYLAAQPPLTPVAPGARATVDVDARRHRYRWSLRAAGSTRVLRSGQSSAVALTVALPAGRDGLYELSLRWGSHRTTVPLVAGVTGGSGGAAGSAATGSGSGKVLVVLPALTWQGLNPVDDDGDGIPNTLTLGQPIRLARPLVNGLPAGFSSIVGLLADLRASGLRYALTTDLALAADSDPQTLRHGYSGLVLAGSERWLPASVGSALNTYVEQGGHILSLGIDALQRTVTIAGTQALDPSAPHAVDALLARPGPVRPVDGSLLLVDRDRLRIFSGSSQALTGFHTYQSFGPVQAPATLLSFAGVSPTSPAVIGYSLGRGDVVDVGLPGFGASLAHNVAAQELVSRVWSLLSR